MKSKFYHLYASCEDSKGEKHVVTVVGKLEQTRERQIIEEVVPIELDEKVVVNGLLSYPSKKLMKRTLTLSLAICHPNDEFNEEEGVRVAKRRIENGDVLGSIETSNVTMLTEDAVMAEILVKLNHITEHIDDYISED